jgi:hypothetical protein
MAVQVLHETTETAGEALAVYRLVKKNGAVDTFVYSDADDKPHGIVQSAAASGDPVSLRLLGRGMTHKLVAAGAIASGAALYPADDGKVDDATTGGRSIGIALEAAAASGDIIECLLTEDANGLLYSIIADGTSLENSTVETAMATKTIDGGILRVGDVIEVIARVWVEDNNSTDTLTVKLYVGTEEIVTTGAVDAADGDIGLIHAFITVRAIGSSGAIGASGIVALGVEGTVTAKPFRKAQASEDLSGDIAIAIKGTWSVAHADNECEAEEFIVILHRQ